MWAALTYCPVTSLCVDCDEPADSIIRSLSTNWTLSIASCRFYTICWVLLYCWSNRDGDRWSVCCSNQRPGRHAVHSRWCVCTVHTSPLFRHAAPHHEECFSSNQDSFCVCAECLPGELHVLRNSSTTVYYKHKLHLDERPDNRRDCIISHDEVQYNLCSSPNVVMIIDKSEAGTQREVSYFNQKASLQKTILQPV